MTGMADMDRRRIVISGCSSGGKSTLLKELGARGFKTVEEPGRQIVREALETGSDALPWVNPAAFVQKAIQQAAKSLSDVQNHDGPVFFDRSAIDALAHCERLSLTLPDEVKALGRSCLYARPVFFAPPWRDIYVRDDERPLPFEEAVREYNWLRLAYPARGYRLIELPKTSVEARADFVLNSLGLPRISR
ncbi:AAA family ATPase [Henriciella marina]|uniref:AAA family ATPase n=1 Tax=Henriciella marina TaxID=453851 RepID=A0ABT4LTH7_9PROT|nr:AAA family ATPase [Henriciella marina]MCZ4297682.1 AAA family ATPase [Henriciella marina]